jgi:hypothetical protein
MLRNRVGWLRIVVFFGGFVVVDVGVDVGRASCLGVLVASAVADGGGRRGWIEFSHGGQWAMSSGG